MPSSASSPDAPITVVLLAGRMKTPDRVGHHDYLGGCGLLAALLEQTPGVNAIVVADGWPRDPSLLDRARSLVLYAGGGRKLPLLADPERPRAIERLVDAGVGLVMIHQAVSFPPDLAARATAWLGGVHVAGRSGRGHWAADHRELPPHPVTRGVSPWQSRDGWLNDIVFADEMRGVTPVLWSGRTHRGASSGGSRDVVSWAYDRPAGGRSFCFTGLDAHRAWSSAGVRQLLVNGTLWTAGLAIPPGGAPCALDPAAWRRYLTPRGSRRAWMGTLLRRGWRRLAGSAV